MNTYINIHPRFHAEILVNDLLSYGFGLLIMTLFGVGIPTYISSEQTVVVNEFCIVEPPMRVTQGTISTVEVAVPTPSKKKGIVAPKTTPSSFPVPATPSTASVVLPSKPEAEKDKSKPLYSDYQGVVWFLKSHERFSPISFWDHKQYTYGWGNKAPGKNISITMREADAIFIKDINDRYGRLIKQYPNLKKDRAVALVLTNLMFNIGEGRKGTRVGLRRAMANYQPNNLQSKLELCRMIKKYNHASGKVSRGLTKRRNQEAQIIMASPSERQELYEIYKNIVVEQVYN